MILIYDREIMELYKLDKTQTLIDLIDVLVEYPSDVAASNALARYCSEHGCIVASDHVPTRFENPEMFFIF